MIITTQDMARRLQAQQAALAVSDLCGLPLQDPRAELVDVAIVPLADGDFEIVAGGTAAVIFE